MSSNAVFAKPKPYVSRLGVSSSFQKTDITPLARRLKQRLQLDKLVIANDATSEAAR
jgi:hypothetical protein